MELKKEFFQEADKAIEKFDSVYEFFKTAKSHNAYQDGARYEKYKKENRMPSSAIIAKFVGFVETDLLYECMKESLDKVLARTWWNDSTEIIITISETKNASENVV